MHQFISKYNLNFVKYVFDLSNFLIFRTIEQIKQQYFF